MGEREGGRERGKGKDGVSLLPPLLIYMYMYLHVLVYFALSL